MQDVVTIALIETVRIFPREGISLATAAQSLLVNAGIWQGWLICLGIPWRGIEVPEWQSQVGLRAWRKRLAGNPLAPTPLTLAREQWPAAPLRHQADDGVAVGLILADLARRTHALGHHATPPDPITLQPGGHHHAQI